MDEDIVFGILFLLAMFSLPVLLVVFILVISAASETRAWQKKKAERLQKSDVNDSLIPKESTESDSESDLDVLDSEDEAERQSKRDVKLEEEADFDLTTSQYFRKRLRYSWGGKGKKVAECNRLQKERDDRRKLAKDVVKVMRRYERRRAKLEGRVMQEGASTGVSKEGLPSYRTALDAKQ